MALPPKGDPRRPLHLAARSTRVLGILLLLLGTVATLRFNGRGGIRFLAVVTFLFYVGPGVGYLIVSIFLKRRALWAVVVGLVLASVHAIVALAALAVFAVSAMTRASGTMFLWQALIVLLIWLAAMAQLIYHLSKSFAALRLADEPFRGFEPLPVQPATPWPPSSLPSAPPTPVPSLQQERPHA